MNGGPGGSRQSEKAPPQGGPIRPPSIRTVVQQQQAAPFPQQEEAGPSSQRRNSVPFQPGVAPPSQAFPLGAGVVQQAAAALRGSSATTFPALHSSAAQQPTGWPSQFDIQQLHSAQVAAAGLRYPQPSTSQQPQPPSGTEMTLGASPLPSLPSPATPSASLFTGIGLSPGSGPGPSSGPAGQTPLQMLGSMNPALLAQYQVILAAAAQQQQAAVAAAASLAAASGGHSPQIGSRVGPASTAALTLEQSLQRYLLQIQQQQQQLAASAGVAGATHVLPPSSPLHSATAPLMTQMHAAAALAAVGVLQPPPPPPPPAHAVPTHSTAPATHPRVTPAVTQPMPSPGAAAETISLRSSRVEFLQPQPLLSRVTAATARQPSLLAATSAALTTTAPSLQAASTSQPHSQAHGRVVLMPPPSLPRALHASTQERRRHAPYQRPTPTVPSASATSAGATASAAAPSAPEPSTSFQMGTLPSQPYYPSHFMRGTVIRLQSGQLKRVEEMSTEDFVLSAAMKTDLILCNSTVIRIQEIEKDRQVLVTFAVGDRRIQVTIEAGIEHPYFVIGQGWASCSPERTRATYGLVCRQLSVGDVCITLRHIERGEASGSGTRSTSYQPGGARGGPAPGTSGMQHSSRSLHSVQSPRRRAPPVIHVERRPGVRSAPPRESPTEEMTLLDVRRRLRRRRRKSAL